MSIATAQRHRRGSPCRICGGHDAMRRGAGDRCFGFESDDGRYVHCSRTELAGGLVEEPNGTYAHYMAAPCRCGVDHGGAGLHSVASSVEVAVFRYHDPEGEYLYEKVKTVPKSFYFRRKMIDGTLENGLGGVERVPYNLPATLAAIEKSEPVFVCEGEQGADAINRLGLTATAAGGESKWIDAWAARYFKNATAVILPDNDAPGQKYAQTVAKSLRPHAASVVTVKLPGLAEKADPFDYVEAGGTALQLGELVVAQAGKPTDGLRVQAASSVKPRNVVWLSKLPPIATGAVQLLVGEPGEGKSTLALDLAAKGSLGKLDGAFYGQAVRTLYATAEDSPEHTLVPRLMAAGADLNRIGFLTMRRDGIDGTISLPDDVAELAATVKRMGAKMIVVDPIMAHLPGDVNSHRDQDVRRALAPMHRLGEEAGVAVLLIMHLNKGSGSVFDRTGGSKGFTGAARNVLLTAPDPEDPDGPGKVLVHPKCNLGPYAPTLRYHIAGAVIPGPDGDINTSKIVWDGEAPGITASSVLDRATAEERGQLTDAKDFLRNEIPEGTNRLAADILKAGQKDGHAERTLRRAKRELGIPAFRHGFGPEGIWFWGWNQEPDPKAAIDGQSPPTSKAWQPMENLAAYGEFVPSDTPEELAAYDEKTVETPKAANVGTNAAYGNNGSFRPCEKCGKRVHIHSNPEGHECIQVSDTKKPAKKSRGIYVLCPARCPEAAGHCEGCGLHKGHEGPHRAEHRHDDLVWETTSCPCLSPTTGLRCKELVPGHLPNKHMSSVADIWPIIEAGE